jgi:hypothetical protein
MRIVMTNATGIRVTTRFLRNEVVVLNGKGDIKVRYLLVDLANSSCSVANLPWEIVDGVYELVWSHKMVWLQGQPSRSGWYECSTNLPLTSKAGRDKLEEVLRNCGSLVCEHLRLPHVEDIFDYGQLLPDAP